MRLLPRGLIFIIPPVLLGLALLFAHLRIAQMGENYRGPLVLVDRIFELYLALGIMSVGFCVGRRVARILSLSFVNAAEEISVSAMLGVGIIGLVVLCLGLFGLLNSLSIPASGALLVILTWREAGRLLASLKEGIVSATATRIRLTFAVLFIALVIILALRAMTPPHSPDEAIYHLSVTKRFVQQGRVFPVVDNWAGNMPFLIQMVYAVCLIAKADIAARLLSLFLAVVCSLSLYAFSARFLTRRAGVVAMFGFFGAGMIVEVAVTSRIDVSLAGMLFLATHAMVTYFETNQRGWLYASAVLSGLSLGIKYTAGIYILLLGFMFLTESFLRRQHRFTTIIKRGAVYVVIIAAIASPWFIKNFVWFGNPVYPFVTGEVAEFVAGRPRYFDAEDQIKLNAHFDRACREMPGLVREREIELANAASRRVNRHPLRFWEYFTEPNVYNMNEEFHYPNYLFIFAPFMLFVRRSRWLKWLGGFSVLFFLAVTYESWIARILIPIYPALTLISAFTITELAARAGLRVRPDRHQWAVALLTVIAVAITLGPTLLKSISQSISANDLSFIRGDSSRADYMMRFYYYPPCSFINSLPERSQVMMIGAQTSYDLKRDYIADVNWDSTEWRRLLVRNNSIEEINEDLKRRGITHVWVAYGLFTFVAEMGRENYPNVSGIAPTTGPDYQPQLINWATLDQYSTKFLEPIYNDRFGNIVYRIR